MGLCYFHETYSITGKKIIFQLLICNKEPFIKLETALIVSIYPSTQKHLLFQMFFLRQMTTKRALKKKPTRWSSIRKRTIKEQYTIYLYLHIQYTYSSIVLTNNISVIFDKWRQLKLLIRILINPLTKVYYDIY